MKVERVEDPAEFGRRVAPLLQADPLRHSLLASLIGTLTHDPGRYPEHNLWLLDDGGSAAALVMQTPPFPPIVGRPRDDAAGMALADGVHATGASFEGINGAEPEVSAFAARWAELTGTRARRSMALRLHVLEQVDPVPETPGAMRYATAADRDLILDWWAAFAAEAHVIADSDNARRLVDARLASDPPGICFWEVDGRPVCLAGSSHGGEAGARVGPVYTPPEHRRRGYGTALTAELTRRLLAQGHPRCMLYTDQANPTSNAIYHRIGYRPVLESGEYVFEPLSSQ